MIDILQVLQSMGYTTVQKNFYGNIDVWKSWYDGDVKSFHRYTVHNGFKRVNCQRYTMGMAKKVAEDWANLLMNEKVKITLEGTAEQEFFDSVCKANNFEVKANEMQEMKAGLGTTAYVARVVDVQIVPGFIGKVLKTVGFKKPRIKIDYVIAPNIFPLSWENGIVDECAFTSTIVDKNHEYTYLQIHHMDDEWNYIIENRLYSESGEVQLSAVRSMANVPPVVHTGSDKPWFVIDRLNIANNVDYTLPMGIPAFANAISQLKGVDVAYDSYVNEFVLGKKRVMVKPGAVKDLDGNPVFDTNELYYYVLSEDSSDGAIIQPIDMTLRTAEHNAGLQDMLNALSSRCGFGENHYRFDNGSVATATQVISENSTMFRTIKKHEIILESVLTELCRIILRLGNSIMGMSLNEDVEISIDFDDSIIIDKQQEESRIYMMLNAGLMRPEEARAMLMNEDIETAKAALPSMENMTDEKQGEIGNV